jgi:F0F1-type ATP synthase assembly protein I
MEKLSKIVVTIVAVVVFFIVGIFINAGTDGKAGWVIIALAAGLIAAIKAIWKKDYSKSKNDENNKDINITNNYKDIDIND